MRVPDELLNRVCFGSLLAGRQENARAHTHAFKADMNEVDEPRAGRATPRASRKRDPVRRSLSLTHNRNTSMPHPCASSAQKAAARLLYTARTVRHIHQCVMFLPLTQPVCDALLLASQEYIYVLLHREQRGLHTTPAQAPLLLAFSSLLVSSLVSQMPKRSVCSSVSTSSSPLRSASRPSQKTLHASSIAFAASSNLASSVMRPAA